MKSASRHFVLNRADARVGLSMMQVMNQAGLSVDVEVPFSKQVPVSLNEGSPLILSNPRSPVTRKLWDLVERLTDTKVREARPPLKWSA
jgi:pilus assembly protein CpaE